MLALGFLAVPLASGAQQPAKVYRIGVLGSTAPTTPEVSRNWEAFRQGLGERGWIEGQNVVFDYRWSQGQVERFPALVAELMSHKPDIIVAAGLPAARAAKEATSLIPIVMVYVGDPVGQGIVASLARPGDNLTGLTFLVGPEIVGKHLELLKEAVPNASRVAVLVNPAGQFSAPFLREAQTAAQVLAVKLQPVEVRNPNELESAFATMTKRRANALLVMPHPFNYVHARRIADLAAKSRLPAMYPFKESVEAGGLMAYAADAPDMFRRAAFYVDKILKGTKPADLPVEQPTRFELLINMKTARTLGLTIPRSVLSLADQVIQ